MGSNSNHEYHTRAAGRLAFIIFCTYVVGGATDKGVNNSDIVLRTARADSDAGYKLHCLGMIGVGRNCLACLQRVTLSLRQTGQTMPPDILLLLTDYLSCNFHEIVQDETKELQGAMALLMARRPSAADHMKVFETILAVVEQTGRENVIKFPYVRDFLPLYLSNEIQSCQELKETKPVLDQDNMDCLKIRARNRQAKSCIHVQQETLHNWCRNRYPESQNFTLIRVETYDAQFVPKYVPGLPPIADIQHSKWTVTLWQPHSQPWSSPNDSFTITIPDIENLNREFANWPNQIKTFSSGNVSPDRPLHISKQANLPAAIHDSGYPADQNSELTPVDYLPSGMTYGCVRIDSFLGCRSELFLHDSTGTYTLKCFCEKQGTYTYYWYQKSAPTGTTARTEPPPSSSTVASLPRGASPVLMALSDSCSSTSAEWITDTPGLALDVSLGLTAAQNSLQEPISFENVVVLMKIVDCIVSMDPEVSPPNVTDIVDTTIDIYNTMLQWDTKNGSLDIPADSNEARRAEQKLYEMLEKMADVLPVREQPYDFSKSLISVNIFKSQPQPDDKFEDIISEVNNAIIVNEFQSRALLSTSFQFVPEGDDGTGDVADFRLSVSSLKSEFDRAKASGGIFSVMLTSLERFQYAPFDHSQIFHGGSKSRKVSPIMFMGKLSESKTEDVLVTYKQRADALFKTPDGGRYRGVRNYDCVYFDYNLTTEYGGWSNKGCRIKQRSTTPENGTTIECECDHLTPFTLFFYLCDTLIDLDEKERPTLAEQFGVLEPRIISSVSLAFSICCILIVLLHVLWKLYRRLLRLTPLNFVRLNVILSVFCSNVTFLVAEHVPETGNQDACLATAVFSHWFMLASFFWMSAETYFLIKVIRGRMEISYSANDNYDGIRLRVALIAWGAPILFPLLSGLSHISSISDSFGGPAYGSLTLWCWIDPQHDAFFLATFVVPVCAMALLNITAFAYYVYKRKNAEIDAGQKRSIRQGTVSVVGTCFLLGATWFAAYVMLMMCCDETAKQVAGVFFILLNGSQGAFVLWVYITRLDGGYRYIVNDMKKALQVFSIRSLNDDEKEFADDQQESPFHMKPKPGDFADLSIWRERKLTPPITHPWTSGEVLRPFAGLHDTFRTESSMETDLEPDISLDRSTEDDSAETSPSITRRHTRNFDLSVASLRTDDTDSSFSFTKF